MLRPVKYRLIEFENERTRHGLIAQEVEDARDALGLEELDENIVHYDKASGSLRSELPRADWPYDSSHKRII
jgi:hypothetical protein